MIQKNTHRLTDEALAALKQDNELCLAVANELGVTLFTLPSMISRNSRRLLQSNATIKIAQKLGKRVEDIITETDSFMPAA